MLAAAAGLLGLNLMDERDGELAELSFADIPGWKDDDQGQAFGAFRRSCLRIVEVHETRTASGKKTDPHVLVGVCREALKLDNPDNTQARAFFEQHFTPHRYSGEAQTGFVTGYYEPELKGSRTRNDRFKVPVYRVPDDLVQLYPDSERAKRNAEMTAGRETGEGLKPYFDRKEIEQGALEGRGLEILWLEDPVDAFYMHIQGSGRVALAEGGHVRLSYAAKNGHPYTAIGKILIDRGEIAAQDMSMDAVREWLAKDEDAARELMWQNRSYIFFRELPEGEGASGPLGAQGVPLTPLRSLAVDTSIHALGTPIWVSSADLEVAGSRFARLMVAQDAGSAILGPQRGDIFYGSGPKAGQAAGLTRHKADFIILLPNDNSRTG